MSIISKLEQAIQNCLEEEGYFVRHVELQFPEEINNIINYTDIILKLRAKKK